MPRDETIRDLLEAYAVALGQCSIDGVLELYTKDGVFMAPGRSSAVGTAALREAYRKVFSTSKLEVTFTVVEAVTMSEEWAFARSTATGTKTFLQQGVTEAAANQELFILRKVAGTWKIARYSFSSMKPT